MPKYYDMLVAIKWSVHDSWYKNFMVYWHDAETEERTLLAKYDMIVIQEWKVQIDTRDFKEFRIYPRDSFKKITCNSLWKITLAFKDHTNE